MCYHDCFFILSSRYLRLPPKYDSLYKCHDLFITCSKVHSLTLCICMCWGCVFIIWRLLDIVRFPHSFENVESLTKPGSRMMIIKFQWPSCLYPGVLWTCSQEWTVGNICFLLFGHKINSFVTPHIPTMTCYVTICLQAPRVHLEWTEASKTTI